MRTPAQVGLLLGLLAWGAPRALAQVPADTSQTRPDTLVVPGDPSGNLESLLEDDLTGDPTELIELLAELAENPLDVNTATAAELAQIPAFDPLTASAVVRFREANGLFRSLPEVQLVEGVTAEIYFDARPYLSIGPRLETNNAQTQRFPAAPALRTVLSGLSYRTTQRIQRRLDTQAGYEGPDSTRAFAGSPERIYTRLQATYRRQVSVNLTLEKDPGEAFRFDGDSNTYGYDYLSGHAAILDAGRIDALIVGDFAAEFGQGLALWRASGFGKGPDAVGGPIRTGRGLRPYGSVEENRFFRGAALSVAATPNVFVSGFASRRQLDANVFVPDTLDIADPDIPSTALDGATVTSFGADGLHRTETELSRKDALGETVFGGGAEVRIANGTVEGRAGVVGYSASFDAPIGEGARPDQRFNFSGDQATIVSAYADFKTRAGQAFGEAVRGAGGRFGGLAGIQADLGNSADLLLIGRHYDAGFTSLHGYPFGERNGVGQNETWPVCRGPRPPEPHVDRQRIFRPVPLSLPPLWSPSPEPRSRGPHQYRASPATLDSRVRPGPYRNQGDWHRRSKHRPRLFRPWAGERDAADTPAPRRMVGQPGAPPPGSRGGLSVRGDRWHRGHRRAGVSGRSLADDALAPPGHASDSLPHRRLRRAALRLRE